MTYDDAGKMFDSVALTIKIKLIVLSKICRMKATQNPC